MRNLVRRRAADADLTAELEAYRAEHPAPGAGPEQWREEVRSARAGAGIESLLRDARLGLRALRRTPWLSLACVLTFALGIAANAVIFSMVNAFVFRPMPVENPDQVQFLRLRLPHQDVPPRLTKNDVAVLQALPGLAGVVQAGMRQAGLTLDGVARPAWTEYVTGNFFSVLGVHPVLGRLLQGDGEAGVVISYDYWQSRFAGDPNLVGRQATLAGRAVTILGVTPRGFHGVSNLLDTQVYAPIRFSPATPMDSMVRLRSGTTPSAADASLQSAARSIAAAHPGKFEGLRLDLVPLGVGILTGGGVNPMPLVSGLFLSMAGLVLLLAAANVAGLLHARASVRQREMAVRAALGAGRGRIARQVLIETLWLALAGGALGLGLSVVGSRALAAVPPGIGFPLVLDFSLDWRVIAYGAALAFVVALVAGLAPALRAAAADPNDALRADARAGGGRQRLRSVLVGVQVAVSLALLIAGGLFWRSLRGAERADLGFQPAQVWNFPLNPAAADYSPDKGTQFFERLLPRVQALPGVQSASLAYALPFGLQDEGDVGHADAPSGTACDIRYSQVSPGYFATMGIPLRGRDFTSADNASAPRVAVISEAMARQLWPRQNAVGKIFYGPKEMGPSAWTIVGVAGNVRRRFGTSGFKAFMYVPVAQLPQMQLGLQVRAANSPVMAVEALLRTLDPNVPLGQVRTMHAIMGGLNGLFLFRLGAHLAAGLGLLGLLLAVVGVYGVVANAAAQRTREIGVRVALGARPRQVVAAIVRRSFLTVALGLAAGLLLAAALSRVVGALLMGVSGLDPLTFALATTFLAAVALLAAWIPAHRASRASPLTALRQE